MTYRPRYGDAPIVSIPGRPRDQLAPLCTQRRRLQGLLTELTADEWRTSSRCVGWSIKDVVAHLDGVNRFWTASVRAGLEGRPTRMLEHFDPVATPERMVAQTRELPARSVLEAFASSNDELLGVLQGLDEKGWEATAEAPPGHLPVRLLASHALWDAWVHERDVVLPLGRVQPRDPDEVAASLRYVCALTTSFAILADAVGPGTLGVEAVDPSLCFVLDVAAGVTLRDVEPGTGTSTLCGDAVGLIEALSTRASFATAPPTRWAQVVAAFAEIFGVP